MTSGTGTSPHSQHLLQIQTAHNEILGWLVRYTYPCSNPQTVASKNFIKLHSPSIAAHLCVGVGGDLAEVILSPSGDLAEEHLLGGPPPEGHTHAVKELLCRVQVLFPRQVLCVAQPLAPGDDGDLGGERETGWSGVVFGGSRCPPS